ncbi:TetR/AcrR family transcriptional regulator [Nocardia sp. NPDC101769]|uniref:TetR/AcrR family transcriptional regulator n=1 Tax=Nocardia sp. NPDC101769 TaxID=3364333 RepID=UPI00382E61A6
MPKIVDHEERRRAISAAACRVIATAGLANTTIRDIAAEAGCTTGMVVHYFDGKRQVLLAALASATAAVEERITRLVAQSAGLYEVLCQCLPMDETRRIEWQVWIAFWDWATHDAELAREQRQRYRAWCESLQMVLVSAGYAGRDLESVAEEVMVAIDGIGLQAVFDPDRFTPERQLALLRRQAARILTDVDGEGVVPSEILRPDRV